MASKTDVERILPGGLNWAGPSDRAPTQNQYGVTAQPGDSLVNNNWRVDREGELRSRYGWPVIYTTNGPGLFHTLEFAGGVYYLGTGQNLITREGFFASGFDGTKLGIAFFQRAAWAMNRAKQVRIKNGVAQKWGIVAPANGPSLTYLNSNTSSFNPYNTASDYSYNGYFDTTGAFQNFPPGLINYNFLPTLATRNVGTLVNAPAPWYFITSFAPSFNALGSAQDTESFTFQFYADQPQNIYGIEITLYSDQDKYGQNAPLVQWQVVVGFPGEQQASPLGMSPQSWTNIIIQKAINVAQTGSNTIAVGYPHFIEYDGVNLLTGFGSNSQPVVDANGNARLDGGNPVNQGEFNWSNITGVEIQVTLNNPCSFGLGAATFNAAALNPLPGNLTYFVSFANADGEDSDPSPPVSISTGAGAGVHLNAIPTSMDPQVTQRWVYRAGGGLDNPLLIQVIPDNTTTSIDDLTTNVTAQNEDVVMPINRTLPPPAKLVVGPYFGKLIALATDLHPARYFWTPAAQPWFFPGSDEEDVGNWEDAGSDDDHLLNATNHKTQMIFYKQRSIWKLVGDPQTADVQQLNENIGLVGPAALVNGGELDYFVGPEGIYQHNGEFAQDISGTIKGLFRGDPITTVQGGTITPMNRAALSTACLGLINDRLFFSYANTTSTIPNVTLWCHLPTGRWAVLPDWGFTAMAYAGFGQTLMAAQSLTAGGGNLRAAETPGTYSDSGSSIAVNWLSRYLDQGAPNNYKEYPQIEIDFQTGFDSVGPNSILTLFVYDETGAVYNLGTFQSNPRTTVAFDIRTILGKDLVSKRLAIAIIGNVTTQCVIYGVYLKYYVREGFVKNFDAHYSDDERVHQFDYVEFAQTGIGQTATYTLESDLPGSLLLQRQQDTYIVPLNARGTVRQRLPQIVEGRQFRLRVNSPVPFFNHTVRIRHRVIGEYIDGIASPAEYFESPEFSVAPGRIGELKDLLLDYDTSFAGGTIQLFVDGQPDSPDLALTPVRSLPLVVSSTPGARIVHAFAFEDANGNLPYGTLFKFRVYPPPGGVVRLHGRATLRARIIGVAFDGSQGESWRTQPLDPFGGVGLYREVAIVAASDGQMTLNLETDQPGSILFNRAMMIFDTINTSPLPTRIPVYARFPGNVKGQEIRVSVIGQYPCRIFEVKLYARGLGNVSTPWRWIDIPLEKTPDEWQQIQIPVRSTPEAFEWLELPVDP